MRRATGKVPRSADRSALLRAGDTSDGALLFLVVGRCHRSGVGSQLHEIDSGSSLVLISEHGKVFWVVNILIFKALYNYLPRHTCVNEIKYC